MLESFGSTRNPGIAKRDVPPWTETAAGGQYEDWLSLHKV